MLKGRNKISSEKLKELLQRVHGLGVREILVGKAKPLIGLGVYGSDFVIDQVVRTLLPDIISRSDSVAAT